MILTREVCENNARQIFSGTITINGSEIVHSSDMCSMKREQKDEKKKTTTTQPSKRYLCKAYTTRSKINPSVTAYIRYTLYTETREQGHDAVRRSEERQF